MQVSAMHYLAIVGLIALSAFFSGSETSYAAANKLRLKAAADSGKRSANAVFLLTQLGFRAYALRDGVDALSPVLRDGLLCEHGAGYLARSGGRTERSG